MNTNFLKNVITTLAVAALFLVPMSFVVLQTKTNQVKNAEAYNPYVNTEHYYGTNGTGQYYNSTFDRYFTNSNYNSYNTHYTNTGEAVAISDFNQPPVFDSNGNYSYSNEYKVDTNCGYYWTYNCVNSSFSPTSNYAVYDNQTSYVFDVPQPNTYNYYNPDEPTFQDSLKTWYPEQDFNYDNGYFNS